MNFKGMLLVVLLAWFGAAHGMSQIEAGTSIVIKIKGIPAEEKAKIDDVYPVSKEGIIKLPHVGEITAAGKTPEQLARDIEQAYLNAKIYLKPSISVHNGHIDPAANANVIHIGGQVARPGPIDFTEGMTLWKAIQAAGGATEFGSLKRVRLYRDGKQTIYDMTHKENFSMPLKANDTIEVPQKSFGCSEH